MTISGGGFTAHETVKVNYRTGLVSPTQVLLCSGVATSYGTFTCSGHIPTEPTAGATGIHTIVVNGVTSLTRVLAHWSLT